MIFDHNAVVSFDQKEHEQIYPNRLVEHNPRRFKATRTYQGTLDKPTSTSRISLAGVANQRINSGPGKPPANLSIMPLLG